ncbi:MAG TPA: hypothetical protein VMU66_06770 [Gaiellales bacterium]|nr:hypothetical protein [Gaiellales bacterium]
MRLPAGEEERERLEALPLSHTPTWGTPELLAAIAGTYDRVAAEHVLTLAGAPRLGSSAGRVRLVPAPADR